MKDVLNEHELNLQQYNISADWIAAFLGDDTLPAEVLFWRDLIDGQLDTDRMDYLLRDSLHCGVAYGHFDLDRVVDSVAIVQNKSEDLPLDVKIGVSDGGRHAAEGLILARYFMFQQVYFHPVRLAYNHHVENCLKEYLGSSSAPGILPNPETRSGRRAFLGLDDIGVLKFIVHDCRSPDAIAIRQHGHDRRVVETSEVPNPIESKKFEAKHKRLLKNGIRCWTVDADNDWYAKDKQILVADQPSSLNDVPLGGPLSQKSPVINGLKPARRRYLFAPSTELKWAESLLK